MSICAKRGCRRKARHAWNVGDWAKYNVFHPGEQGERHYEVCTEHSAYFAHPFNREQSEAVSRDLIPWTAS